MYKVTLLDHESGRRLECTDPSEEDLAFWLMRTIRHQAADRDRSEPQHFELTWWDLDAPPPPTGGLGHG